MGKGKGTMSENATQKDDLREETLALERKADAIRREVDMLIAEADRRRHKIFARQLRSHPLITAGAMLAVGLGAAGMTALVVRYYQRRYNLGERLLELGRAAGRVARRPDRIGRTDPNLPTKLAAAVGTAVVGTLAKRGAIGVFAPRR